MQGAVPGLLIGTYVLAAAQQRRQAAPIVVILLGLLLTASSSVTFIPRVQNQGFAHKNSHWLPWLALPIGVEAGFSSAGAGALGTVLLLNYSEMTPPEVVGTDILFGLVLAVLGSAFHWKFGSISGPCWRRLLEGGIPGVVIGCLLRQARSGAKTETRHRADRDFRRTAARLDRRAHADGAAARDENRRARRYEKVRLSSPPAS